MQYNLELGYIVLHNSRNTYVRSKFELTNSHNLMVGVQPFTMKQLLKPNGRAIGSGLMKFIYCIITAVRHDKFGIHVNLSFMTSKTM